MKINAVIGFNKQNISTNKVSFSGYKETLSTAVRTEIKDTKSAEKLFGTLFDEVNTETNTHKNPIFYELEQVYKKRGFMGFLDELRHPEKNSKIKNALEKKEHDFVQAITQYGQPLLELFNFGKFGSAKDAPNDIKVIFRNQSQGENIEFNLGKKLNLNIARCDGHTSIDTEYYTTTGTPKVIVENSGGSQTKTFYNEDGTLPFFKNWLRGGTVHSEY